MPDQRCPSHEQGQPEIQHVLVYLVNSKLKFEGYVTSIFASLAKNPVLRKISQKITDTYNADKSFYDKKRPILRRDKAGNIISGSETEILKYAEQIFERTGPKVFNEVLKTERPDYYEVYNNIVLSDFMKLIANSPYEIKIRDVLEHYVPFYEKAPITIGNANSWETNR
ncbi:hypothetical protein [Glaciimonas immobilis]|uniref:Uncharacterized protein n=1 Tax=Glaciimonas immobilis TaxID=728004 RepID=A0A840RVD7_9BURK|nr:hypothetical protein [Glaciimonas immobilis]KAF3997732.1 hypothetical protein HAV38_13840 [Glaciimonas immobilis]MBB5200541.1 hypothetical protein [Glaciimonas immobilis]